MFVVVKMSELNDEIRNVDRMSKIKTGKKIYCRVGEMSKLARKVLCQQNCENDLKKLYNYVDSIEGDELQQFGEKFNFKEFLKLVLRNKDNDLGVIAFKILSKMTYSGEADYDFFTNNDLIQLCNALLLNEILSKHVIGILINGCDFEDFAINLLDANICLILTQIPVSLESAMLVCALTNAPSKYIPNLLDIAIYILNSEASVFTQEFAVINYGISCYAFKAIHHICRDLALDVKENISKQVIPVLYENIQYYFGATKKRYYNALFRLLGDFNNVPPEFAPFILDKACTLKYKKIRNQWKIVKNAMIPFSSNAENWKTSVGELFLNVCFTKFGKKQFKIRLESFKTMMLYYDYALYSQFTMPFIEWCLAFVEDESINCYVLEKLITIVSLSGNSSEIQSLISTEIGALETISNESQNENASILASKLLDLLS